MMMILADIYDSWILGLYNYFFEGSTIIKVVECKITVPEKLNSGDEIAFGRVRLLFQTY